MPRDGSDPPDRRRRAAERQRAKRLRDALGLRPHLLYLPEIDAVETVVREGLISEIDALDDDKLNRALEIFLRRKVFVTA